MSRIGTLYTLGYADPDAAKHLECLMEQSQSILVDIRYSPRSRWFPRWNRSALTAAYGHRYIWDRRLGNINYDLQRRKFGIQLAEGHIDAVQKAAEILLQGTSLILLCACKDAQKCHRVVVAKLIQDALQAIKEVQI
jgi:uncharacterized protein (DUF488 family)